MKNLENLKPCELVSELDRYIIGQCEAKKAVAVAFRNRNRRKLVEPSLRDEIVPKNILMIGSTGVGKTEIARRLAKLTNAPFVKVEATNFTEVGYVGKDVDSIIKDILEVAVKMKIKNANEENAEKAKANAKERILELITAGLPKDSFEKMKRKEEFSELFDNGKLDDTTIDVDLNESFAHPIETTIDSSDGVRVGIFNVADIFAKGMGVDKKKKKTMKVRDAFNSFVKEEEDDLLDEDEVIKQAIEMVEQDGIVFIDEIDKVSMRDTTNTKSGNVSREGVQRDLLPLIEGTVVSTKYGPVKTDYILFIASGSFHNSSVSDLLPEFQGRFPVRVQLKQLTEADMVRILKEPESSLIKQYIALMKTENVNLDFTDDAINEIAKLACLMNQEVENIGARRLHTLLEKILEELSYNASEMKKGSKVKIDSEYVKSHLGDLNRKIDLMKFVL